MKIRKATIEDIKYILGLANKESKSIGFIPKPAYEAAVTGIKRGKRWSLTCNDGLWICEENEDENNPDPVGFVLASFGKVAKVNQIVIQDDARLIERGKALLDGVIEHGEQRGIYDFGCGCADDLESNKFWKAMEWIKVGERKGIHHSNTWKESSDRKVNIYRHQINDLGILELMEVTETGE
jgi:N-acetylglutamate synthase-like GNAT family acetyltransferase